MLVHVTDLADQAVILPVAVLVALALLAVGWPRGSVAWLTAISGTLAVMLVLKVVGLLGYMPLFKGAGIFNPSGHVAAGAMVYGGASSLLVSRHRAGRMLRVLTWTMPIALLLGLTRVALGLHTLAEVAFGAIVGSAGVAALICMAGPLPAYPPVRRWPVGLAILSGITLFHGHRLDGEAVAHAVAASVATYIPATE